MESLTHLIPLRDSAPFLGKPEELRHHADSDGYLYFSQLLDPSSVLRLRCLVLELCQRHGWLSDKTDLIQGIAKPGIRLGAYNDSRWHAFLSDILPHPEFLSFGTQLSLLSILECIFGNPAQPRGGNICRVVSPRTADLSTKPHQERAYIADLPLLWVAWIPLGDCPIDLGPVSCLPGSHKQGLLPHVGEGEAKWIHDEKYEGDWATSHMSAGDVVLFHNLTVHRALDNLSINQLRLSADFRFTPKQETVLP